MNAYNAARSFAAPASTNHYSTRQLPFAATHSDPNKELHNPRGLVIAVMMSAACWAGVGLAFLI